MDVAIAALALGAAAVHVAFFALEAVLWRRPPVHRLFGARTAEQAELLAPAFVNLGFYNLFLGLGAAAGTWWWLAEGSPALLVFCLAFMVAAAIVLVAYSRGMWRGAVVQGALPAVALVLLAL
ncbi:DUF1304 domain-containing protein [uncultured Demequina sp.]|uniref:DUF1304 domain-containing protein n=1 Tax=uncultured Demequina sp. TaxID=693499 RepID=UPI0025F6D50F|nr:DUF1304 domain-containing protein [uncultured Demequina sp.]